MILMPIFKTVVVTTSLDPVRQIANAHTIFNVTNTIILLPFSFLLVKLVTRLVPGEPVIIERGLKFIDDRLLETPSAACRSTKRLPGWESFLWKQENR